MWKQKYNAFADTNQQAPRGIKSISPKAFRILEKRDKTQSGLSNTRLRISTAIIRTNRATKENITMHNQETNVPWSLASGEFQKVGTFSPSFPIGAEWSCPSAGNPQGGLSLRSPLPTPRRKLSLETLDDSTQSPPSMESIDSGECLSRSMRTAISSTRNPTGGHSCTLLFLLLLLSLYVLFLSFLPNSPVPFSSRSFPPLLDLRRSAYGSSPDKENRDKVYIPPANKRSTCI